MSNHAACIILAGLCLLSAPASADEAADRAKRLERWLREPATPAVEVLLLESAGDPRVDAHWQASLSHPDPTLRAAAARAIRAAGRVTLAAAVAQALQRETEPLAASELAEASIELGAEVTPVVLDAVARMPQPVAVHVLRAMSRMAPGALPVQLPALLELGLSGVEAVAVEVLASHIKRGTVHGATTRAALARRDTIDAWRVIGQVQRGSGGQLPMELLALALRSETRGVAEQAVVDYLDLALAPGGDRAALVKERAALEALSPASAPTPARFAREVVSRLAGDAPAVDLGALGAALGSPASLAALRRSLDDLLKPDERSVLDAAWGRLRPAALLLDNDPSLWLPRDLPHGVWSGLEAWARCRRMRGVLIAAVTYNAVGRVSNIALPKGLSDGCRQLIGAVARISSSLAPGLMRIAIPLGGSLPPLFGTRLAEAPARVPIAAERTGNFVAPVLKKSVKPDYPRASVDAAAEGRVWLDVVLDEAGRVREVGVVRSAEPHLDAQAMLAMLEWQFGPARLAGQPVPCRIVVEMEFSLRR